MRRNALCRHFELFHQGKTVVYSSVPSNGRQTFERYCEQDRKSKFATIAAGRFSISAAAEDGDATKNNLHFHGFIYSIYYVFYTMIPDIAMKLDGINENGIFRIVFEYEILPSNF